MFAPAHALDPLRIVQGLRCRYDCPDLAALDGHLDALRRRVAAVGGWTADLTCYRTDIDRLLDRRSWLTLPVTPDEPVPRAQAKAEWPVMARPTMSDCTVSVPS